MKTETKSRHVIFVAAMIVLGLLPFLLTSASTAKDPGAHITLVRTLKTRKLGIKNPAGLAFSMNEQVFHVVESRGASQPPSADSDVILITARPAHLARTRIPAAITDPINITFDDAFDRLLVLLPSANILMQIKAGPEGRLNPNTLAHFDVRSFGLQDPQGMAVDPASGDLLVLDRATCSIVRVSPAPDGSFDGAAVSRVDLQYLGSVGLRGLAVHPVNGHLHVLDNTHYALYELTSAGQVIAIRDLSSFNLKDPRGMVFAPSGDQTDSPSRMSLYLADSGMGTVKKNQAASPGQVMELSLDAPLAAGESTYQSTLIRTTDLAALSPPSPDPSGLTFVSSRNSLLMSDGEVEEKVSGITHFQGANLWELTLTGGIVRTANISSVAPTLVPMSDEPTGVAWNPGNGHYYFSDDNDLEVFDLNPGADRLIGTADDSWTSFSTHGAGDDDPEGITYDSLHDRLFVADGDNREIYEYTTTGALVSHFDVLQYGVVDPESVEFNPDAGTLFVLGNAGNRIIIETTPSGALLRTIDVSADSALAPAGLAYAPASDSSGAKHFYILDRGIDNNEDPNIIDGKMYEMTAPSITPGNKPPTVNAGADQTIIRSQGAQLQGSVSDDGIPGPTLSSAWSKASGPGTVTFSDPSSTITTATFSALGSYVLRLTIDDGELVSSDDVNITVTGDNGELPLEVRVAASSDDAEESASGIVSLKGSDLELVYDGSNQKVGMRFNGINIPQGTTITNAYIQFTVDESQSESTALTIQGQNADQAAAFTSATNNVSSRARTVAAVSWSPNPWTVIGAAGPDQQTPNIASVIQEIVNRPGWSSGNSLAIIITGTGHRTARAYDYSPAQAPLLYVEYRPPAANHAPVAAADTYSTNEDTSLVVAANGVLANDTDADGDILTALRDAGPSHGTLTLGTAGGFTYTPSLDFNGSDSFTYHANDGKANSNVATVAITVNPVNDPPVANAQSATTAQDAAKAITLTGSDVDGDTLTYAIVAAPAHGTLTGTAPNLTYTPAANYNGSDSFTFNVNDGKVDSAPVTVSITVTSVNHPPVANAQSVTTAQDTAEAITLTGSDADGDTLTYAIVAAPANGTLTGTAPNVTYTPSANYSGSDGFTFKVNDGKVDSAPATVSITVTSVNHPPVANAQAVTTAENTAKAITLTGSDVDGDTLTYSVVTQPAHGTLTGTVPNVTYTPAANYSGSDSFTFKVKDGKVDSNVATVTITITPVNDPPLANAQSVTTAQDTARAITLSGSDVDGDALTYSVVAQPGHGTLSGTAPSLTYAPVAGYSGTDSFTFNVNDGSLTSAPATVAITVTPSGSQAPIITSLSPASVLVGGTTFTLTVNGNNFVTGSLVQWNGSNRTTTFVSSQQLTAAISASDIAAPKTVQVTVYSPAPVNATSNAQTFTVNNPSPTATSLSPASANARGATFTLSVYGSGFVSSSVIRWNGVDMPTDRASATRVKTTISAAAIAVTGTVTVTVFTPAPGGGISNALTFTINDPPAPTVTDRTPFLVTAGGGDFTLTVNGTNFVSDSVVRFNGAPRTTTFVSSTKLTATILASDIAVVGTYPITVYTPAPGGGASNAKLFYVGYPVPTTAGISPATASPGGAAFTLTVDGSNYVAASLVRWNGVNVATTFVSSSRLTAVIPASNIAVGGTAQVTVYNPATGGGGGTSNAQTFTIN
jgi:VCBS repeat-containing protein